MNAAPAFDNIPEELKQLDQWVLWRMEQRGDKITKVPIQTNKVLASTTNPETWASFENAKRAYTYWTERDIPLSLIHI